MTSSPSRDVALVQLEERTDGFQVVAYTVGSKCMVIPKRNIPVKGLDSIRYIVKVSRRSDFQSTTLFSLVVA